MQQNGNQTYYDSSFNTLRLDSTHPDTYNLVGFSGCLRLWWIPLLEPELLEPELCVTGVTMNQNLPHHKRTASPNPSLKLGNLAQARRARSSEPPLRLCEGSIEHSGNITGSRLGETPLAWARCSLAQNFEQVAWATFRAIAIGELPVSSRLGETDSLGRD
ncbi:hypothetical protein DEO72_LG3g1999 [Vigna unguiculata]|uniref:Uncharacterized protein n=1 Tax=Vigna unguiculata TaxID=3917 RepID=A0A4D6LG40_VIGUN|nr:hypothetical protein DEO72_LG3g1999 [Vigna unguiculata]